MDLSEIISSFSFLALVPCRNNFGVAEMREAYTYIHIYRNELHKKLIYFHRFKVGLPIAIYYMCLLIDESI